VGQALRNAFYSRVHFLNTTVIIWTYS